MPFISITIPAYRNVSALQCLLDSIAIQTFTDYEVIITDDTPDSSVEDFVVGYHKIKDLKYFRNQTPLGTPENWNEGIRKATGTWIKIMHHDDYFARPDALEIFTAATQKGKKIICSGYSNNYLEENRQKEIILTNKQVMLIEANPWYLFASNSIGPPSVTLIHQSIKQVYDAVLRWFVDIDYYIRLLADQKQFEYINQALIGVGIHAEQVTQSAFRKPAVELPEALNLIQKYGTQPLQNIRVYDAWWRLFRNLSIRKYEDVLKYTPDTWPSELRKMIWLQSRFPAQLLKKGVLSKIFMMLAYLRHRLFS